MEFHVSCEKFFLNLVNFCLIYSAVICDASLKILKPRSAYWCYNTSLLDDKHFKDAFTLFWEVSDGRKFWKKG